VLSRDDRAERDGYLGMPFSENRPIWLKGVLTHGQWVSCVDFRISPARTTSPNLVTSPVSRPKSSMVSLSSAFQGGYPSVHGHVSVMVGA
jgi:hypothetical protein